MPGDNKDTQATLQMRDERQLVVLVRFAPEFATAPAAGMLGGAAGAIEGAASAAESAAASIPGLNLFITEEKAKSTSDTEYKYFNDYGGWDASLKQIEKGLKQMNPESLTMTFEFSGKDSDGRKSAGEKLAGQINNKLSSWSGYTSAIHFVGLGQGGNVINECTKGLQLDEKWRVETIIYIATPLYKTEHQPDKAAFKKSGQVFSFGNRYDLTQHAVAYTDDPEKLLTLIKEANKGTLKLATGMLKLRIVKALAVILSGLHLSADNMSELNKFSKIIDEVKGVLTDFTDLIKKLVDECKDLFHLPDLPKFSQMLDGLSDAPGKAVTELKSWIDGVIKKVIDGAKNANVSVGLSDLSEALNVLCPVIDAMTLALQVLTKDKQSKEEIAGKVTGDAGLDNIYAPGRMSVTYLAVDEDYAAKALAAAQAGTPDMAGAIIMRANSLLGKAAAKTGSVSGMDAGAKQALAEAIAAMAIPMMPSKAEFFKKLMSVLPFNPAEFMKSLKGDEMLAKLAAPLAGIGIKIPEKLKASVAAMDGEIGKIRGFVDKSNYKTVEGVDTLYLAYNSHNIMLAKLHGPIANKLDDRTGYLSYMKAKGYDNNPDTNEYTQAVGEEKEKAMPTNEIKKNK